MTGSDRHPGDRLAALADGRLPEWERLRVLEHLAGCRACRSDYDAQVAMKGLLRGLDEPGAPVELRARLSRLAEPSAPPPAPGRPNRRSTRPARSARRRTAQVGAGLLSFTVLGLAGAYAVGGSPEGAPVAPPIDRYVREHAAVTGGFPLTEPVLWQLPASPAARSAQRVTQHGVEPAWLAQVAP